MVQRVGVETDFVVKENNMEMVALVIACIFAVAVIQHQRQSMERLVRIRKKRPDALNRRRRG